MGSNTEKKPWTNIQNSYKIWSKEIKSNNFRYLKVVRAITKWAAIEKSQILLSQYWIFFSHFDGSNNILVDCIMDIMDDVNNIILLYKEYNMIVMI